MTPPVTRPAAPAALAMVAVLTAGGCADRPAAAPEVPPPAASSTGDVASPAPEGCGDVADQVRRHLGQAAVRSVTAEGQCTTIVVTAVDADPAAATRLCDAAARVAYTGDVNSVRILGPSGDELANGIAGADCLTG
ncbi:hypothetical protein [Jidongwangia harbinensis]|uniref:hypothetical protein n=1 Tax=Jidongwangia harbinensis TaxID=2878561 RepID=UPI001CD9C5DC|nr:hypothetical protein [Jidongwangia harbinensis]MCA2214924.1 hypothetical protein [Jidongwangia harbinensis]